MNTINLYEGELTLNKNFVLRKSNREYSLYNIVTDFKYTITPYLFYVLKIFQHNCTNLTQIKHYFESEKITDNINSVNTLIKSKLEFENLIIESDNPSKKKDIYKIIEQRNDQIFEFTPEGIDFLITNKCNLKCPHCYRNSTSKDKLEKINLDRLYKLFDEMEYLNVHSFKITGGEAFLCPELFDLVSYASTKRIHTSILTNATIPFSQKWLSLLAKENISLGISLDGATPQTHDIIRGNGSFVKTMHNLDKLLENRVNYSLTFTINSINKTEIEDFLTLVKNRLKNKFVFFNFIERIGRARHENDILSIDQKEKREIRKRLVTFKKMYSTEFKIGVVDNNALENTEEELQKITEKGNFVLCKAGLSLLAIDAQLNVYPCIYGIGGVEEYPVANLNDDSLINIWNHSSKLDVFRGNLKTENLPACYSCNFQNKCNLKYCRLRPLYEGGKFIDPVSFCMKNILNYNSLNS